MSPSVGNGGGEASSRGLGGLGEFIRLKLLGTVFAVFLVVLGYAYFFVDNHLEWFLESTLSRGVGAEVNVGDLRTGWLTPGVSVDGVRVTDPDTPTRNLLEVDEFSVALNLDALLRMKVVVEESALRGVAFGTSREEPGWVAEEGGDWSWVMRTTRELVENSYHRQAEGTFVEDVMGLLGGSSPEELLDQYRDELTASAELDDFRSALENHRKELRSRSENLPDGDDIEELQKNVKELGEGGSGLDAFVQGTRNVKRIRDRLRTYKTALENFREAYESARSDLEGRRTAVEDALEADRRTVSNRLSVPSMTLENPSADLFDRFVRERLGRLHTAVDYAKPYLPTGGISAGDSGGSDGGAADSAPTEARYAVGIGRTYTFPTPEGYPGFWLKRFDFGTKSSTEKSINLWGNVRNVSTFPAAVDEPVEGAFEVSGMNRDLRTLAGEFRSDREELTYRLSLEGFELRNWRLADGESFVLGLEETTGRVEFSGSNDGDGTRSRLELTVPSPDFLVRTPRAGMTKTLEESLDGLGELTVRAELAESDSPSLSVTSNLDQALRSALGSYVEAEVESLRKDLIGRYESTLAERREALRGEDEEFRRQFSSLLEEKRDRLDAITDRINENIDGKRSRLNLPSFGD